MDQFLSRYRNFSALVVVILAQLVLLAYQVKSNQDVRLLRVWSVTAITPAARLLEGLRSNTWGWLEDYFLLRDAQGENRRLKAELGRLKLENQFLRSELATADRARALATFQFRTPSRTIAARIIGSGTAANSRVVFVDRGSNDGVMRGLAVITPDGIVGKVTAAYPTASQVLLITDTSFAAGVISQKHRIRGTLKGLGHASCLIDYVQPEEKVEVGEQFFTSGDDRVFPKGLPVGAVSVVRDGNPFKQIIVVPSGFQSGLEEVLIVLEGVHQPIPELQVSSPGIHVLPPPPTETATTALPLQGPGTEADRLREQYRRIGEAQGHVFGEGLPGSRPPNFNLTLPTGSASGPGQTVTPSQSPGPAATPTGAPPSLSAKPAVAPAAAGTGAAKPSSETKPSVSVVKPSPPKPVPGATSVPAKPAGHPQGGAPDVPGAQSAAPEPQTPGPQSANSPSEPKPAPAKPPAPQPQN